MATAPRVVPKGQVQLVVLLPLGRHARAPAQAQIPLGPDAHVVLGDLVRAGLVLQIGAELELGIDA